MGAALTMLSATSTPRLLLSPTPEAEALALRMLRSENRLLFHTVGWASVGLFLVALNVLISRFSPPWSLYAVGSWGLLLAAHALYWRHVRRRADEDRHRRLSEEWEASTRRRGGGGVADIRELREKLLTQSEAARRALRSISPETVADVSKGEARALDLVAWLDSAEPLLAGRSEGVALRQRVADALSRPMAEADRNPLDSLLTQLDLHDVKLAGLEREAEKRRSVLESFLLVLESAGATGSSSEVLTAVSDPLRGRVKLLEEVAEGEATVATGGEQDGAADERIREEVRLAQELQDTILPNRAPEVPGLVVAHHYRPSSEVGGDFFDFYRTAPGRLLIAVGDASGHGLDSSMLSSMMKSALYTHVSAGRELDEAMVEMNRMMCDTIGRRRLMTLALVEIDVESRRLRWVNAGHVFPLIARGSEIIELEQSTYPLGVRREVDYAVVEEELYPGDRLVVVTDGTIEALDPAGEVYGWERLGARLRELAGGDSKVITEGLKADVWAHLGGKPPQDDVTLVVATFEP
jgi:serine phosphatase RsbU (regulator of sigma subunit)